MEEDFLWSFSTNQPAVIASVPAHNTIFVPPDQAIVITFDQPMERASAETGVLVHNVRSGGPPLQVAASWNDASTELTLARLGAHAFSFTTGAIAPSITFVTPSRIATYSASTEPVLFFETINHDAVNFSLYRLSDREAEDIIQRNRFPGDRKRVWHPSQAPIRTWVQAVDGRANALTLTATSLSGDGPLPKGHYYLITNSRFTPNLLFSVVDTTLITKLSVNEFLVWALDYETGAPLSGVPVQLDPARNGIVARTGPDGLASFAVPPPNRFSDQERAHTAKVDANGRLGIVSSRWSRGTEPYQLGLPIDFYPRAFVGHLFTDRPIYRPGETVFYKGTLRLDDDARYSVPQDTSVLHFIIRDPHFNELTRLDVTVNEFGTFAGEFVLPPGADTGRYSLSLERRDRFTVTSAQFRIAEFRTPEFEVTVTPATETVVDGDQIVADAEATFFFGGPLADAAVT